MNKKKNLEDFLPNKKVSYIKKFSNYKECETTIDEEDIIQCIRTVMDPEIPVNLYDLGLIYSIKIIDNNVKIEMTLTNPNCPVAGEMPSMVANSIKNLNGFKSVEINLVWEPPWTKDMMTEDAKLALDID